jgi:hypothetical protein
MFGIFNDPSKERAKEVIKHATLMIDTLSPTKLARFEARVPRRSIKWKWIVTALATYTATRIVTSQVDDAAYQKILAHIPRTLEEELGRDFAVAFADFFGALREDYKKRGEITAAFLGQWAVSKLSPAEFPAEIGIREMGEIQRIGEELLLIVTGKAGFGV